MITIPVVCLFYKIKLKMSAKIDQEVPQKQPDEKPVYKSKVLDYTEIRNLKNTQRQPVLLPGLGNTKRRISKKQQQN